MLFSGVMNRNLKNSITSCNFLPLQNKKETAGFCFYHRTLPVGTVKYCFFSVAKKKLFVQQAVKKNPPQQPVKLIDS
jgi:hypothetical protein